MNSANRAITLQRWLYSNLKITVFFGSTAAFTPQKRASSVAGDSGENNLIGLKALHQPVADSADAWNIAQFPRHDQPHFTTQHRHRPGQAADGRLPFANETGQDAQPEAIGYRYRQRIQTVAAKAHPLMADRFGQPAHFRQLVEPMFVSHPR